MELGDRVISYLVLAVVVTALLWWRLGPMLGKRWTCALVLSVGGLAVTAGSVYLFLIACWAVQFQGRHHGLCLAGEVGIFPGLGALLLGLWALLLPVIKRQWQSWTRDPPSAERPAEVEDLNSVIGWRAAWMGLVWVLLTSFAVIGVDANDRGPGMRIGGVLVLYVAVILGVVVLPLATAVMAFLSSRGRTRAKAWTNAFIWWLTGTAAFFAVAFALAVMLSAII
jgi:hypothetical protein